MGNWYGYNRVSSKEQHLDRGNEAIKQWCKANNKPLEKIYMDKQTGKNYDRPRYTVLKEDVLRAGDNVVIPEYDRLGRANETKIELEHFKKMGVRIVFLDIPTTQMDLDVVNDDMAKMIMGCINDMLISFYDCLARSELERKKKRQREGYESLKLRGEWDKLGRPRKMAPEEFAEAYQAVVNGEIRTTDLKRKLNLTDNTYYRYVKEYRKNHSAKE